MTKKSRRIEIIRKFFCLAAAAATSLGKFKRHFISVIYDAIVDSFFIFAVDVDE
jgi:hypothetical protein